MNSWSSTLFLAHASEHPELMNNFGNIKLLSMMEEAGLLPEGRGLEIGDAYRRYRKFQHEFRLNAPDSIPVRVERERVRARDCFSQRDLELRVPFRH